MNTTQEVQGKETNVAGRSSVCRVCRRRLRNPRSIAVGMGTACARKFPSTFQRLNNEAQGQQTFVSDSEDVLLRRENGKPVTNIPQVLVLHSPDGFEWGYGGSGPADLALNILLRFGMSQEKVKRLHQDFKWKFISTLPQEGGIIPASEIRMWIQNEEKRNA